MHANIVALWSKRLAKVPTRVIISERNTLSKDVINSGLDLRMWLMPLFVRLFYPWADGIIAVSTGVANDLAQITNLHGEQIKVIYNPIVTPKFQAKTQEPLNHCWFKPGEPPVVLSVGRLSAQKGFDILIRSFNKVREAIPARLLILGDGEARKELEALVNQLGLNQIVSMPGFVPNPYPFMMKSGVFVLSSRWEGLPGVLIEALYCGTRLVSTDCPNGAREILAEGKYGRLVPVGDVDALAQAIIAALHGDVRRPPPDSWRPYELETVMEQYLNVLFG